MRFPDLSGAELISLDIETRDESINKGMGNGELRGGFIAGISLATPDGFSEYYPIAHEQGTNCDKEKVLAYLKKEFSRQHQDKLGHNIMYDVGYLIEAGVPVAGKLCDTQLAEGLLDENGMYSLDELAKKYVGVGKDSEYLYDYLAANFGGKPTRKTQAKNIWRAPGHIVRPYAVSDVILPLGIFNKQKELLKQQGLSELFELETGLLPMLMAMRRRGVRIDTERTEQLKTVFAQDIHNLEKEIYGLFGKKFNLASSKQLGEEFNLASSKQLGEEFTALGIDGKKTAKGKLSTAKAALSMFKHPAAKKLLELREMSTLLNTFLTSYCTDHLVSGRLHCQLHPLKSDDGGTVTGRFSCSKPNLQNIPKKKKGLVRALFLPEAGETWFSDDMSQIEYRLLVHYARGSSADASRKAYTDNPATDYHDYVRSFIVEKTQREVTRSQVKAINFGLMYTKGKKSLATDLGLSLNEAEQLFITYHSALPYVQETQRKVASVANQRGWVKTLTGRRRRFDLWESGNYEAEKRGRPLPHAEAMSKYSYIKRAKTKDALNFILQGGCADILKTAMLKMWQAGVCNILGAPLTTVHDELNWSVPNTIAGLEAHKEAVNIMQTCVKLSVPLLVSSKSGKNWGELN